MDKLYVLKVKFQTSGGLILILFINKGFFHLPKLFPFHKEKGALRSLC